MSWPAKGEVPMPSRSEIRRQVIDALSRMEESEADTEEVVIVEEVEGMVVEEVIYIHPAHVRWRIGYVPAPLE